MYTPPPSPPRSSSTKYHRERDHDPIPIRHHRPHYASSTDLIFSMSPPDTHFFPPTSSDKHGSPLSVFTRARQLQHLQARRPYPHVQPLYSFPTPSLFKTQERRATAPPSRSIPLSGGEWYEAYEEEEEERGEEEPDRPRPLPPSPTLSPNTLAHDHHDKHSRRSSHYKPPHPLMLKDPPRTPLRPDMANPHKSRTEPIKIVGFDVDDEDRGRRRKWR